MQNSNENSSLPQPPNVTLKLSADGRVLTMKSDEGDFLKIFQDAIEGNVEDTQERPKGEDYSVGYALTGLGILLSTSPETFQKMVGHSITEARGRRLSRDMGMDLTSLDALASSSENMTDEELIETISKIVGSPSGV